MMVKNVLNSTVVGKNIDKIRCILPLVKLITNLDKPVSAEKVSEVVV